MKNHFFKPETENLIKNVLKKFMDNVLKRRLVDEPWDYNDYALKLPFHVALIPEEIWKGAKFERSFVTSLGMIGWEEIAKIVAQDKRGIARRNEMIVGKIYSKRVEKIHQILKELEHGGRKPNWERELQEITSISSSSLTDIKIVADLFVSDQKTNDIFCFEIKSPKPNSDQTKVSKEKILELINLKSPRVSGAFFALPFNPFGSKEEYNHSHPFRWFNMREDDVVLMGSDFWEMLGGKGTYEALILIFNEVGMQYKDRIKKEYLGI